MATTYGGRFLEIPPHGTSFVAAAKTLNPQFAAGGSE
jgi:hypothetical protein